MNKIGDWDISYMFADTPTSYHCEPGTGFIGARVP